MIDAETLSFVSNVGFPIAVTLWFMFRMEKIIKDNTAALHAILEKIN